MMIHLEQCNCNSCNNEVTISYSQKTNHITASESSRRDFLKQAGGLGITLGIGSSILPLSASALQL